MSPSLVPPSTVTVFAVVLTLTFFHLERSTTSAPSTKLWAEWRPQATARGGLGAGEGLVHLEDGLHVGGTGGRVWCKAGARVPRPRITHLFGRARKAGRRVQRSRFQILDISAAFLEARVLAWREK